MYTRTVTFYKVTLYNHKKDNINCFLSIKVYYELECPPEVVVQILFKKETKDLTSSENCLSLWTFI